MYGRGLLCEPQKQWPSPLQPHPHLLRVYIISPSLLQETKLKGNNQARQHRKPTLTWSVNPVVKTWC